MLDICRYIYDIESRAISGWLQGYLNINLYKNNLIHEVEIYESQAPESMNSSNCMIIECGPTRMEIINGPIKLLIWSINCYADRKKFVWLNGYLSAVAWYHRDQIIKEVHFHSEQPGLPMVISEIKLLNDGSIMHIFGNRHSIISKKYIPF